MKTRDRFSSFCFAGVNQQSPLTPGPSPARGEGRMRLGDGLLRKSRAFADSFLPSPPEGEGPGVRGQRAPDPQRSHKLTLLLALALLATFAAPLAAADDPAALLTQAKTHLAKGRYEEALEVFHRAATAKADPVAVALGESHAQQATGAWEDAEKTLDAALVAAPKDPRLLARRAQLHFLRGRLADAEKSAESARQADRENILARLVLADLYAETGRLDEANEAYRWFIRYYNERQPEDAASLLWVAEGSIQYARWNHN